MKMNKYADNCIKQMELMMEAKEMLEMVVECIDMPKLKKVVAVKIVVPMLEKFVLDTRYTINLLVLTTFVVFVGALVYLGLSLLFKSKELSYFAFLVRRMIVGRKAEPIPAKETEPITPTPGDSTP